MAIKKQITEKKKTLLHNFLSLETIVFLIIKIRVCMMEGLDTISSEIL